MLILNIVIQCSIIYVQNVIVLLNNMLMKNINGYSDKNQLKKLI